MLLTIIVPVYNGEKKIRRCLDSLEKLKEERLEFLIINDGSTDYTAEIVANYVKRDSRFRLVSQQNAGVSSARNKGIEVVTSEYIGFVDADDEVTEDYNYVIEVLREEKCDFYGFDYVVQTKAGKEEKNRNLFKPEYNEKKILYQNFLSGASNNVWSNIYRTSIIKEHKLRFDQKMKMGEDCVFNAQYILNCDQFYYISCVAYKYYYDDTSSASFKISLSYLSDFIKMYENVYSIYELDEELNFSMKWELYFGPVYKILKKYGRTMSKKMNREFRRSRFYRAICYSKQGTFNAELRRWMIRANVYRIFLP